MLCFKAQKVVGVKINKDVSWVALADTKREVDLFYHPLLLSK
jgi:hypothetical protein